MKKDRQQLRFIPLETFKKNVASNPGLHSSCETVVYNSSVSIQKEGRGLTSQKVKNPEQRGGSTKDTSSSNHIKSPSTSPAIDRKDCVCVEALNRRKIGNLGPPIAPPRPSSTIENSSVSSSSKANGHNNHGIANPKDLKLQIPPSSAKTENMPNLIVTYSKVGIVHHTTQPTPPSCGGIQASTSFEDPLTPPPSYDSAISTPDKHFSLYSISNAAAPSIT